MVRVRKWDGRLEEFDPRKLERTLIRAGADREMAQEVVRRVEAELYDGIPTRELLRIALGTLRDMERHEVAARYDLKRAIMRLGPSGYPFERYVARVLEAHGHRVLHVGRVYRGTCVEQEVDVAVESGGRRIMVECKFHNSQGIYTDLKPAMYTHARFLDLREYFDGAWLVTNTRVTEAARRYAECVGLRVTWWDGPEGESLKEMIDGAGLYPVTSLDGPGWDIRTLISSGVVTLGELASLGERGAERLGLPEETARRLVSVARLVAGDSG